MKNFLIIARAFSDVHSEYTNKVQRYIEARGGKCIIDSKECPDESELPIDVDPSIECIISIGGDGTVVRVAHNTATSQVPIVGLNCGHLGYLCDIHQDNVEECLDVLLSDGVQVEDRMMLEGGFIVEGNVPKKFTALNDIVVVSSAQGLGVINLTVSVNGIKLYNHDCDGLIVSTPTGSTAYNLSANGPIVSPHSECIVLTPINPHTLNSRSIILAATDEVEINIESRRPGRKESALVIYDGMHRSTLSVSDTLRIHKSVNTTKMVRLEKVNFLERIRARMQEI